MQSNVWETFKTGRWTKHVDVRNFIQKNYKPYEGDESFLVETTEKTKALWAIVERLMHEELDKGILDVDTDRISGIDHFEAGYIDKSLETIVGLQTDGPLKRMINPFGGIRMAKDALEAYGFDLKPELEYMFSEVRKTHNQGVFDAYTDDMKKARSAGLITGLPDAYGRGRIIGDFRRLALYGINRLVEEKKYDLSRLAGEMTDETIRLREEVSEQIRALGKIANMAKSYGYDVSEPAKDAKEAIQFVYFAYLAGIKENNGAAMSLGRVATFLDVYIEKDLASGAITESEAQEMIDHFVMKLRMVRHLRTPDYNSLFAGDPNWVTEGLGGMGIDGRTLVSKTTFRFIHTLTTLGPSPEPNMTVLWSDKLPEGFKRYCSKMSILTDSLQYENDDVMRPLYGDDYGIACCVSAMTLGKQMQFFGARCNLSKSLLYAINDGKDEKSGKQVIPSMTQLMGESADSAPIVEGQVLEFNQIWNRFEAVIDHVAGLYVNSLNVIHYMHDKYAYEAGLMALHDTRVDRLLACGIAGLSVVADSLSAIRYAKVTPIFENGIIVDYAIEGDAPQYGNDDDRVDDLAVEVVERFSQAIKEHATYRNAKHTLSVLTITSNVIYGKKTGSTPDGRKAGEPFAPGANPMHGREHHGALASLNSVSKICYRDTCQDGVSNTFTIIPDALGNEMEGRIDNLVDILDGYFIRGAQHLNVNVLNRAMLEDAMENPDKYPNLTIRVSGYAVNFSKLTREQQMEVLMRTFHERM